MSSEKAIYSLSSVPFCWIAHGIVTTTRGIHHYCAKARLQRKGHGSGAGGSKSQFSVRCWCNVVGGHAKCS
eukprot:6107067-Karenia_brevis.AAC.1